MQGWLMRKLASGSRQADEAIPDYYEMLQISPNADPDMIHRVYRLLAQRYHPDNADTGDERAFRQITDAYKVSKQPEKRAAYDVNLHTYRQVRWQIFDQKQALNSKLAEKSKRRGDSGSAVYRAQKSARLADHDSTRVGRSAGLPARASGIQPVVFEGESAHRPSRQRPRDDHGKRRGLGGSRGGSRGADGSNAAGRQRAHGEFSDPVVTSNAPVRLASFLRIRLFRAKLRKIVLRPFFSW